MYAAIWRALPGPLPVRLLLALLLLAGIAYLLVFHLYPWIMQELFPTPDPVLDATGSSSPLPASPLPATSPSATSPWACAQPSPLQDLA